MKYTLTCLALLCATHAAQALEVSNLDHIDHRVLFEAAGTKEVHVIKAGETEYFAGQPNGTLSLIDSADPKASSGPIHADGILSGVIGNGRTANIPADVDDVFAIWPNGEFGLQQRRHNNRDGR